MTTFETFSTESRPTARQGFAGLLANAYAAATLRIRVWKNRRQVARLLSWDDHMLSDIGLTQGDVYCAMATRVDEDASVQLSMLSLERRFARNAQMRERLAHGAELHVGSARYRAKV
ncbi:protein of unknown function [Kaistia soli DSM 19436]|uniref:YjiS-like domain-containing protein n=1 Tax=Kaistia soli DSM 19436 TaxID=1122133 RepID=A0A1M4WBM1_9HYPH|nr:DUF1127 domain-containing protein [Kaistia soli]SHE78555.1 protein of unknown function [Kaistia soli DSM 19436]